MEKRALVLALAMTLPLALYGIPYAYASVTQSTYVARNDVFVPGNDNAVALVQCLNPADSTQHFAIVEHLPLSVSVKASFLNNNAGGAAATGENPNGWTIVLHNSDLFSQGAGVQIVCQTPITVAGIGAPEFGSLYVAIALGALVYFMLWRQFARRPTISAQVKA